MQRLMNIIKRLLKTKTNAPVPSNSGDKVKLVAIAKDEASYFQEWVHHHLYFGFDDIEIHINRTSDNSAEVLNNLCEACPTVSWFNADWIDKCPQDAKKQIQFIVYNKVWDECVRQGGYSHILFLDIDEFWIPRDLKTNIHDYLSPFGERQVVSFEWLNDLGTLPEFATLPRVLEGNLSPLVKTVYPIHTPVIELRHHVPLMAQGVEHMLADKQAFKARENLIQAVHPSLQSLKNAFIYHRAHRSVKEYISLLYRGRPGESFPYKTNRHGLPVPDQYYNKLEFNSKAYDAYQHSLREFLNRTGSKQETARARDFVEQRFNQSMTNLAKFIDQDYTVMMQMFRGVYHHEVVAAFKQKRAKMAADNPQNFRLLRDLAIDASSQDIDEAIALMERAASLNPDGPVIQQKLAGFRKIKHDRQSAES